VKCWEVLTSFGGGERQCGCRDGVDDVLFELPDFYGRPLELQTQGFRIVT
jgi:hypothetical protein